MATPRSLTPQPVHPSRPRRHFTLQQANRSLPLVKRIIADVVAMHQHATELQAQLELGVPVKDQRRCQEDLEKSIDKLHGYVDELNDVGCELKDYRLGLIDFIGRHQGHEVCLCWKQGEESIAYWHELEAGFSGRQPVASLEEGN